jgi:chemotaxis protein MotB
MKRSSTPFRPAPSGLAALALVAACASGCVTRGKHNRIVGALESERSQLSTRVADLERSNTALGGERLKLLDEMEDLRMAREGLATDVAQLEKTRDLLSSHLREREAQVAELSKLSGNYEQLVKDLESEVASGQIQITQLREGLRLNLAQDILFRSGSTTLEPYGVKLLMKVSSQLSKFPQQVEVQGHSDDVPLSKSLAQRWGSNWELAAARAAQVVRLFEAEGVDPSRLRAVSYGPHNPVADNDSPDGRARNRRIEIRLIPIEAAETSGDATPGTTGAEAASERAP